MNTNTSEQIDLLYKISELPQFISVQGVYLPNELKHIRKNGRSRLIPIYEAFTNAWESFEENDISSKNIRIEIYSNKVSLIEECEELALDKIIIKDDGVGLNDKSMRRLLVLRDNSKNRFNLGTGRVQYIHRFNRTAIRSYCSENGKQRYREVELSKADYFLAHNAIAKVITDEETESDMQCTQVLLMNPLDKEDDNYYANLSMAALKKSLIEYFFARLSEARNHLPKIEMMRFVDGIQIEEEYITAEDIPECEKVEEVNIQYKTKNQDNKIVKLTKTASFQIRSYSLTCNKLKENKIYLVSNKASVKKVKFNQLKPADIVDGKHLILLISGDYINEADTDERGMLMLLSNKTAEKRPISDLIADEFITFEDIVDACEEKLGKMYDSIPKLKESKAERVNILKNMFLLDDESVDECLAEISNSDTDESILKTIYHKETEKQVKLDAKLKMQFDALKLLSPSDKDYSQKLKDLTENIVRATPIRNRNELSRYVAHRRIVLEMLRTILSVDSSVGGKKVDEASFHNLFFRKGTADPACGELWVFNEEYIYFSGLSDVRLKDAMYDNKPLFCDEFLTKKQEIDEKYFHDNSLKKPDILLLPSEGKCIIIEFKAPDVEVSKHLDQITDYAGLIREYARDGVEIRQFYGYLIGENINNEDIRRKQPAFQEAVSMGYLFRPYLPVLTFKRRKNDYGSLYTEIISYSALLLRAQARNQIFMEKLGIKGDNYDSLPEPPILDK